MSGLTGTLERIIPFIPALEPYLLDPTVTEVMVNPSLSVYVERDGRMTHVPADGLTTALLTIAIGHIAHFCGALVAAHQPLLEARLEGGARVSAAIPPASPDGPLLVIRKFPKRYTLSDLVEAKMLTTQEAARLRQTVRDRQTILVSGGTGSGKTTLLNALTAEMDPEDRVAVLEETSEIWTPAANTFRLEAQREQPDAPALTMGMLLRTTLRLRPDRIILGEVRGAEAWDFIQAINTGHPGGLSTIHANSASEALVRLAHCALSAGLQLPIEHIQTAIRMAVAMVVQVVRQRDGRRQVWEILLPIAAPLSAVATRTPTASAWSHLK